jgi:hypothetical protein
MFDQTVIVVAVLSLFTVACDDDSNGSFTRNDDVRCANRERLDGLRVR